jgi:hypothetical protein
MHLSTFISLLRILKIRSNSHLFSFSRTYNNTTRESFINFIFVRSDNGGSGNLKVLDATQIRWAH